MNAAMNASPLVAAQQQCDAFPAVMTSSIAMALGEPCTLAPSSIVLCFLSRALSCRLPQGHGHLWQCCTLFTKI